MSVKKSFPVLLALVVALSFSFTSAIQPAEAAKCTRYHTVRPGETLSSIGQFYGVNWQYLADLNDINKPGLIFAGQRLCVSTAGGTGGATQPSSGAFPSLTIVRVVRNKTVTVRAQNFPDNETLRVLMGPAGSQGIGGIRVDTIDSSDDGSFTATFDIPGELRGNRRITIRLVSRESGFFAYNTFVNQAGGGSTGSTTGGTGGAYTPGTSYSGFPTFSIVSVSRNNTVTIRGVNFPSSDHFNVTMSRMGQRGLNGFRVASYATGDGGTFTATFDIPSELDGLRQISIRLESPSSGYFAYNWFYNTSP
jgi:LysM repeat protein